MVRRTVNLPESVEATVRELAREGESFSAAVARLIEAGAKALRGPRKPLYVGVGKGPTDLSLLAEKYLREPVETR